MPALVIDNLRLSHSTLALYRSCARKFEFKKLYKHASRQEELAPEVGKTLHVGYQSYLQFKDRERALYDMMLAYPIHLCSNPTDMRSLEACYATLNAMMDSGTFLEYQIATIKCQDGTTRKAVEVPFEITLTKFDFAQGREVKITYVGFIDAILYDTMTGEYVVVDIKTTRFNIGDMTPVYQYDEQCIPYALVLETVLGHKVTTLQVKYMSVFVDIQKATTRVYSFEKSEADVIDWARGLLVDLQNIKMMVEMGWFKRNSNACVSFGKVCGYFDMCHKRDPQAIQSEFLMNHQPYVEMPIDPWFRLDLELTA